MIHFTCGYKKISSNIKKSHNIMTRIVDSLQSLGYLDSAEWLTMPPDCPALLTLATLGFRLIMFTLGIMPVFYLILFSDGFSDIHTRHNKMA